ncbi:uncharacterized protein LOC120326135 isoform X2 [Styela clava]
MKKQRAIYLCYFLIVLVSWCYGSKTKTIKASDLEVKIGHHDCISDCTHISARKNQTMFCSIEECGKLEIADSTAQSPEIEEVFLERYVDENEGRVRLALHVQWSPVDNVSLEKTKGYVINITDGIYSYSACYNITTKMDFHANGHDIYYNDCFGKARGTRITPDSEIKVYINSLPQFEHGIHDGSITLTVKIPGCSNEELHLLTECEVDGGRPTKQPCAEDCNTYSVVNKKVYPVECSLSSSNFMQGPEKCADTNKTIDGTPSAPRHMPREREWYKYIDPGTGDVKLALNFSWLPGADASMEKTHGYHLLITPLGKGDLTFFNKCFGIYTVLVETKHANAEFFYDCYGRTNTSDVAPGTSYHIHLNSIPQNKAHSKENFIIKIPNCVDGAMQDVTECISENNRRIFGRVEEVFCHNRSIKYNYSVSAEFGKLANIVFCERGLQLQHCKNRLTYMENLLPQNVLYNISLPSSANLSIPYTIYVEGVDYPMKRSKDHPDFSVCVTSPISSTTYIVITVILIVGILILLGVIFLFCFTRDVRCSLLHLLHMLQSKCFDTQQSEDPVQYHQQPVIEQPPMPPKREMPQAPATIPQSGTIRVYVVFADDHKLHTEAVHWFCSYLKSDLGLDVRMSAWEVNKAAINPAMYMTSNLKDANKVIVICSEGTKGCLDQKEYDGNMFSPVIHNICQQSFIGQHPGKFLVGYFDYSKPEHVPDLLHDQCLMYFSLFKLMKQFEPFYFRLVEIEQYQEGGIHRIDKIAFDRYHEPELTQCGMKLKESIEKMSAYVRSNPTWYTDKCGEGMAGSNLPELPTSTEPDILPDEGQMAPEVEGQASISYLHMSAPPQIPNEPVSTGARPKVMNAAPPAQYLPPQNIPQPPQPNPPPMYGPRPAVKRVPYEVLSSGVTSNSTDESFVVDEKDTEDLMSTSYPPHPAAVHVRHPPAEHDDYSGIGFRQPGHANGHAGYDLSYHPESFHLDDPLESESSLLSNLPSNETQITRIGLTDSMELPQVLEAENLISIEPAGSQQIEIPDPRSLGESGVFTLAQVDDNDDEDIEDQFKSINLSMF